MKIAPIHLVIFLTLSSQVHAATYPPLVEAWNMTLGGDFLDVRDSDEDGVEDITVGLFSPQGSYAYLLNKQGVMKWRNKISVIWPQNSPNTLLIEDLDGNGNTNIIVGSVVEAKTCDFGMTPYSSPIFVLERNPEVENNMLKWVHKRYGYPIAMDVGELGDEEDTSNREIVSGTRDGKVYAIDDDGQLRWDYDTEGTVKSVKISDLNDDGLNEVLLGSYSYIHALKNTGSRMWRYRTNSPIVAIEACDLNRDGMKEVIAVTESETATVLSAGGEKLWTYNISALKPTVTSTDLDQDNYPEVYLASADYVYSIDETGKLKWSHEIGYPIVKMESGDLSSTSESNLLILGARKLTSYKINEDYLSDLLADQHYLDAKANLKKKDYRKARNHALRASEIFLELDDRHNYNLAERIADNSIAYVKAITYEEYAQGNYSQGEYETSKQQAINAKNIYTELNDSTKTQDMEDLINKAIDQVTAHGYYHKALEYSRAEDYVQGGVYARKAHEIFTLLNDTSNMEKAAKVVNNTRQYQDANTNYDLALRRYQEKDYVQALANAREAKDLYSLVGDSGRLSSTLTLLTNIEEKIEIEEKTALGYEKYNLAYGYYNISNYHSCIEYADKASGYFKNVTHEEGMSKTNRLKEVCQTGVEAQRHYAKAYSLYGQGNTEAAKDYAGKARQLYRSIEDMDGAIKTSDLLMELGEEGKQQQQTIDVESLMPLAFAAVFGLALLAFSYSILKKILGRLSRKPKTPEVDYTALMNKPQTQPKKQAKTEDEFDFLDEIDEKTLLPTEETAKKELDEIQKKSQKEKPKPKETQPEEPKEDIVKRLDDILTQAGIEPPPTKPAKPEKTQPEQTEKETQEPEEKPEKTTQKPKKKKDTLKTAEEIMTELQEINKKLGE